MMDAEAQGRGLLTAFWESFSPLNRVLFFLIIGIWIFTLISLPQASAEAEKTTFPGNSTSPPGGSPGEPDEPIPGEDSIFDGHDSTQVVTITDNNQLVTTFPSNPLACSILNMDCGSTYETAFGTTAIVPGVTPISQLAPIVVFDSEDNQDEPVAEVPLEVTLLTAMRDRNLCRALTKKEAEVFLCERGINGYIELEYAITDATLLANKEVTEEYYGAYRQCMRNIALAHFSASESDRGFFEYFARSLGFNRFLRVPSDFFATCSRILNIRDKI